MVSESTTRPSAQRYGPITFTAALGNSLLVGLATWYFLPWFALAVFVLPVLLVDLALVLFWRPAQARWANLVGEC